MRLWAPSVRARLTFWHAGVLTVIICLFSGAIFVFVKVRLDRALNDQIHLYLKAIEKVYREEPWDLPELDRRIGISLFEIVERGSLVYRTPGWPPTAAHLYRIRVTEENGLRITVAQDETALRQTLRTLALILAIGVPGAVGLAVGGGYFVAGRPPAPSGGMGGTARRDVGRSLVVPASVGSPR